MNERIKELAEQAGLEYGCYDRYGLFDEVEFAELIVRECAQFIFVLDAEPVSHQSAARLLQEHFGVK